MAKIKKYPHSSVYMDKELHQKVKDRAKQEGKTLSSFIIEAIEKYLKSKE